MIDHVKFLFIILSATCTDLALMFLLKDVYSESVKHIWNVEFQFDKTHIIVVYLALTLTMYMFFRIHILVQTHASFLSGEPILTSARMNYEMECITSQESDARHRACNHVGYKKVTSRLCKEVICMYVLGMCLLTIHSYANLILIPNYPLAVILADACRCTVFFNISSLLIVVFCR